MLESLQLPPTVVPSWHDRTQTTPYVRQLLSVSLNSTPLTPSKGATLHLPRILCLHGGGTNSRIFRSQCRALRARLASYFRLVFAEAPFYTTPGPDVVSVYENWGPFRAWLPPGSATGSASEGPAAISHSPVATKIVLASIEQSIKAAMDQDDSAGATGPWTGLLGFSQGAKMAASLLLQQQNDRRSQDDYRFAVLFAGRAPMVSLSSLPHNELSLSGFDVGDYGPALHLPTIHVHGLQDPGLPLHRDLLENGCRKDSTRLIEWDGDHRVPIRSQDVKAVVDAILDVARETGAI
ncbi:serine hydrolase-domain-containing protein [Aspergillus venezuelensis]